MEKGYLSVNINSELLFRVLHAKMYYDGDFSSKNFSGLNLQHTITSFGKVGSHKKIYRPVVERKYSYDASKVRTERLKITRSLTPVGAMKDKVVVTEYAA